METKQVFNVSFTGIVGRDRKHKRHSIDIGEIDCDMEGNLIDPSQLDPIKEKAKAILNSAKEVHPASIPMLRSYYTEFESDGHFKIKRIMPFSDKNKSYLLS